MALKLILDGQSIPLKTRDIERVGAGGEGSVYVYRHTGQSLAIKKYHQPSKERFEKVRAAIDARPANSVYSSGGNSVVQMAWPVGIVQENGNDVGFAMPYVSSQETLDLDYFINPILGKDRRHIEPPNLAMRLQIALNLCSVVKSLHDSGHYFIDFKPANVKVYPRSLHVCLIDCDSYSIKHQGIRYPATAYSPQFINPVALVNNLHPSKLGEDQDNWAIAVALFQIFNFDLHPYDGKASGSVAATATDDFVKMGLYAYGFKPNALVSPKPQSVHTMWPNEIRQLFDKAFSDPQNSPAMALWIACFKDILDNKRITRCERHPNAVDHLKFLGFDCMQCAYDTRQRKVTNQTRSVQKKTASARTVISAIPGTSQAKSKGSLLPADKIFIGIVAVVGVFFVAEIIGNSSKNSITQQTGSTQSKSGGATRNESAPIRSTATSTLLQLDRKQREERFNLGGYWLRVPDSTEIVVIEELRWCKYEHFRLTHFTETAVGKIPESTLRRQIADFTDLCMIDKDQRKEYIVADDNQVNNELKTPSLRNTLLNYFNLR